jgi:hypothetical protein
VNPFVQATRECTSFCKAGCGACVSALKQSIRSHATDGESRDSAEWEILASLTPEDLASAPSGEQRLRHLVWQAHEQYPHLDRVVRNWLAIARRSPPISDETIRYLDFLVWDLCHKRRSFGGLPEEALREVFGAATACCVGALAGRGYTPPVDSLAETLLIFSEQHGIDAPELRDVAGYRWPRGSRVELLRRRVNKSAEPGTAPDPAG